MPKNDHRTLFRLPNILDWIITFWIGVILGYTTWGLGGYLPFSRTMVMVTWMMIGLLVLHAIWFGMEHRQTPRVKWLPLIFIPYLAWMVASYFFVTTVKWQAEREVWVTVEALSLLWVVIHNVRRRPQVWFLILLVIGVGLMACIAAFYQFYVNPKWLPMGRFMLEQYENRASGCFGIPNSLAAMLLLQLPFLFAFALTRRFKAWIRIVSAIVAIVFLFTLILTGSRGGWLGLIAIFLIMPFVLIEKPIKQILAFLSIILILAISGFILFSTVDVFKLRLGQAIRDGGEQTRPVMWRVAWQNFIDHPYTGSGLETYGYNFEKYTPEDFSMRPVYAHSDYLQTLSDLGIIGFIFLYFPPVMFLILFWLHWRSLPILARPKGKREKVVPASKMLLGAILMAVIGFSVHLVVDFHLHIPALLFNCVIWLGLGIKIIAKSQKRLPGQKTPTIIISLLMLVIAGTLIYRAIPYYNARNEFFWGDDKLEELLVDFSNQTQTSEYLDDICQHFRSALEWDENQADAWCYLGYATTLYYYLYPEDKERWAHKGIDSLTRALQLSETPWNFWSYYGYAFHIADYPPEVAEPYFLKSIEIAPNHPNTWYFYSLFLKNYPERRNEALQALEKVLKLDPEHKSAIKLHSTLILP